MRVAPSPRILKPSAAMKNQDVRRCLATATVSFLLLVPTIVAGQEEEPQDEAQQPAEEQVQQAPVQRLFVSDKLVLNVYEQPDQGGSRVATLETGDSVDELARENSFVHVRLPDGREGWVGASYLTTDAPAAVRLRELQQGQRSAVQGAEKKAAEEIARLKKESAALQAELNQLKASATVDDATSEPSTPQPAETQSAQLASVAGTEGRGGLWWWSLGVVLALGVGFLAGYQSLASRIRKKFGGLKVY
jgi:SH3 domain protein